MQFDFADAMRSASELTRRRKLAEATRVIQDALSGRAVAAPVPDSGQSLREGTGDPGFNSVGNLELLREGRRSIDSAIQSPAKPRVPGHQRASRAGQTMPLGAVIRNLRHAKLRRFGLGNETAERSRPVPVPEGAQFLTGSFTCAAGSRTFKLYIPRRAAVGRRPLLVMLHGCTQDPNDFALGTRMNVLEEEDGFLVVYPAQSKTSNPSSCWNWFNPQDQMRGAGEPSIIAGITHQIIADYDIDPERVFVAGMSAGGAMAAVMGTTYPDLYSAIGVHSGLPHGSARDVVTAFAAMRGESDATGRGRREDRASETTRRVRVIAFHGDADPTVHPSNAEKLVDQFRRIGDEGDARSLPGELGERQASRTVIRDNRGRNVAELWKISGAGHAWSGGSVDGSYTDPQGPDASREIMRFFLSTI